MKLMVYKIIKTTLFILGFFFFSILALYSLFFPLNLNFEATPNTLFFNLALLYLEQLLFILPLLILIGVIFNKTSKLLRIKIIIVIAILFFSLNFGITYLQWQSLINDYRYPNATNISYSRPWGSIDEITCKGITFESSASPWQVEEYYLAHIPPNLRVYKSGQIPGGNLPFIEYVNSQGLSEGPNFEALPSGGTKVTVCR